MEDRLKTMLHAARIAAIVLFICGMASPLLADVVLLSDDFNRPDSNIVSNGWIELDSEPGAEVGIEDNQLRFIDTSDLTNRPMIYHSFPGTAAGQLTWSFTFDWTRSGSEGGYSIFMQLGSSGQMTYPSTNVSPDEGVAVNLVWTVIGGTHEMLGYSVGGSYGALVQVSGPAAIEVVADLSSQTYTVTVDGSMIQGGIPFDNAVSIDTVRYVAHQVNESNFSGRNFDDVVITTLDCTGPDNWPPVAHNQTVSADSNTDIDITLTATDCEGSDLTFSIVDPPAHGDLSGTPPGVNYLPDTDYAGSDSFTFKANDGEDDSNIATVSISVIGDQGALIDIDDFNDTTAGIYWEKARYEDLNIPSTDLMDIPFGIALPSGYDPAETTKYPLVLYLHGAGARGDNNAALVRSTARFFADWDPTDPAEWNAFVLAPQCPSSDRWVEWNWGAGPYNQTDTPGNTYGDYMHLTENLLDYLTDSANNGPLFSVLGLEADDVDLSRIYVVGDSMGAYGTWDIVARQPGFFAGAIASGGSGPKNRLAELRLTPFWAIHGEGDTTVPNYLPHAGDPDGAGSLGMLGLLDPSFNGITSTDIVYVDDPTTSGDDPPETWTSFIYSEFPNAGHAPAADWTTRPTHGVREWLFAQALAPATCAGDLSGDGDSDGEDLARLINDFDPTKLAAFADDFGDLCQ